MKWITEHNIKILDIDYKTKTCRVRLYGCPMRKHENNWYFSVDDRCVWYLAKDVRMSLCYSCEEGENLGDFDYEDWACCRCHRFEHLPEGKSCEFYKKFNISKEEENE